MNFNPIYLSFALGSIMMLTAAQEPSTATPADKSTKQPENEPTLKWTANDQKALMKGTLWSEFPSVLPNLSDTAETPITPSSVTVSSDNPAVEPIPENHDVVDEYFLPSYIRTNTGLIDPQKLLSETERHDVEELIQRVKKQYKVNLFVSIFAAHQKIPPSINAPTVARQVFIEDEKNLLLHFHIGNIKATQIALDKELTAQLGDAGRRDLLYHIKQDASKFTDPQDELIAAIISFIRQAEGDLRQKPLPTTTAEKKPEIPKVNIIIKEEEKKQESALATLIKSWSEYALQNITGFIIHAVILIAFILTWIIWRNKRVVTLYASEPDVRLSAPNGASQSRIVKFNPSNSPNSLSRQQMREHMRNVS